VGITLGASAAIARAADDRRREHGWLASLSRYVDVRFLLVGSLLPDIIDKPVGQYFFRDTFDNGRIFAHTLLFFILLLAAGFFLWKRNRSIWMLSLAAGTFMHLILDESWLVPGTLFWPLLGLTFPKIETGYWLEDILQALLSDPKTYISELVGLIIVVWFGAVTIKTKNTVNLIKYGKMT
jgi:membrane-bound metal-dependent hydrolase YbcI (DUF457 family)